MAQITQAYINSFQIHSSTSDIGFVINQDNTGLEFPGIRISPYPKPGEHGSIVPNQFYDGRTINLAGRISGNSINQFLLNKRSLTNAMRIIESSLNIATPLLFQFTTLDSLALQCYCYLAQPPVITDKSLNHAAFQIQLFAPDPYLYDQTLQIQQINIPTGGGAVLPWILPIVFGAQTGGSVVINNAGDSDMFPTFTFYGPLTSPYLLNLTTGAQFTINLTLNLGDTLVVDMANKTMLLNGMTNAMQFFNYLNTWLSLQPGNNIIKLGSSLSGDTGYCVVAYRNSYVGI